MPASLQDLKATVTAEGAPEAKTVSAQEDGKPPPISAVTVTETKHPDEKPSEVSITTLLAVHNSQEKVTNTLYNFRALVSIGVLGFVYQNPEFSYDWLVKIALTAGFLVFSIGNGMGAVASQKITASVAEALRKAAPRYGETSEVLLAHEAISARRMMWYQVILTLIALVALWFPNIKQLIKGLAFSAGSS